MPSLVLSSHSSFSSFACHFFHLCFGKFEFLLWELGWEMESLWRDFSRRNKIRVWLITAWALWICNLVVNNSKVCPQTSNSNLTFSFAMLSLHNAHSPYCFFLVSLPLPFGFHVACHVAHMYLWRLVLFPSIVPLLQYPHVHSDIWSWSIPRVLDC